MDTSHICIQTMMKGNLYKQMLFRMKDQRLGDTLGRQPSSIPRYLRQPLVTDINISQREIINKIKRRGKSRVFFAS